MSDNNNQIMFLKNEKRLESGSILLKIKSIQRV